MQKNENHQHQSVVVEHFEELVYEVNVNFVVAAMEMATPEEEVASQIKELLVGKSSGTANCCRKIDPGTCL